MDFSKLNAKLNRNKYLPVIKIADLQQDKVHIITRIQRLTNEYGPTIVIDLDDKHALYLPKKVVSLLSDNPEGLGYYKGIENSIDSCTVGYVYTGDRQHKFVAVEKKKISERVNYIHNDIVT